MSGGRPRAVVAVGVLLWIAAVAAAVVPLLDQEVGGGAFDAAPLPARKCSAPEIGVHSTLAFEQDAERRTARVAAIHESLSAQVVRDSLLWHHVERVEGELDWSDSDGVIESFRDAGIEPLLVVFGSPSWANGVPASTHDHYLHVPPRGPELDAWIDLYSDFLAAAVERYKDVVRRWEIWNEPNLAVFWRPKPDPVAYRQVYERLRATILRIDPDAQVAVGGLGGLFVASRPDYSGHAFLRRLIGADAPLDFVAIHPYTTDEHAPQVHVPGEKNFDDIERVHNELLAQGEGAAPIWVTEWGWSSAAVGEERQARYVDRSLTMIRKRYPFVRVATYFLDRDLPPEFFSGLLGEDLNPKPAAFTFSAHAKRLAAQCRLRQN